ncbi:hypothetical protein CBS101457_000431 [Exobasidium rhododendri]|nr:hypothetical protein CBS101457_000431 [Exobasidium rhododendri]
MTNKDLWSIPSWETLFAGKKAFAAKDAEAGETQESAAPSSAVKTTAYIANVGLDQEQLEEELQGALKEKVPGVISPPLLATPNQAHLVDVDKSSPSTTTSDHVYSSPSTSSANFPHVIRKSMDDTSGPQSILAVTVPGPPPPPPSLLAKRTTLLPGITRAHAHTAEAGSELLTRPVEACHPVTPFSSKHVAKSISLVHRGGGHTHDSEDEVHGNKRASMGSTKGYDDIPSGQWAKGIIPAIPSGANPATDLWETLASLFGSSTSTEANDREGFLGAISNLQRLLGETPSEKKQWRSEEQGSIDRALQQSTSSSSLSLLSSTAGSSKTSSEDVDDADGDSGIRHQATYLTPRLPIVFAHGLFGFDTLDLAPSALKQSLPALSLDYWRGISDTLKMRGVEVLVAKVPMSASIEERAASLRELIEKQFPNREVNLIAHSMGGLDGRMLASQMDTTFTIRSLTTIATPHRGSTFADFLLDRVIGKERLPMLLNLVEKAGIPGGGRAFACLTTHAMKQFNEQVHDSPNTVYMSWGAAYRPGYLSEFRIPWGIVKEAEGDNDGLVSVESSKWAEYRGTLIASHLDLIGWTNRIASFTASLSGGRQVFDPKILYLTIAEDLAIRGL